MKRNILLLLLLASLSVNAQDKVVLTLDKAISKAQDSTVAAMINHSRKEASLWNYKAYEASKKPQVSLELKPGYIKELMDPGYDYFRLWDYNNFFSNAEIKMTQQSTATGGDFYAKSQLLWSEFREESEMGPRVFGTTPLAVGYSQSLIGYNKYKWERELEEFAFTQAEMEYAHELYSIAENTAALYFEFVKAQSLYDIYSSNYDIAVKLYEIGKEKFDLASISHDELMLLQLEMLNSGNTLEGAAQKLEESRNSFLSYLNISEDGRDFTLEIPQLDKAIYIDESEALHLAEKNNPEYLSNRERTINALQESDKAKKESGLQFGMDVNLGLQYYGATIYEAYGTPEPLVMGSVSLKVPIIDHSLAKSRRNAAEHSLEKATMMEEESLRQLRLEVLNTLARFNTQQEMVANTRKALDLADETFSIVEERYVNGESDINTLTLAQNRKDTAYENYLTAVQQFWNSYYHICSLCVHEF